MHIPRLNRDHIFWSFCLRRDTNHPDQSRSNQRTDGHTGEASLRIKGDCRGEPISTIRNASDCNISRSADFGGAAPGSRIQGHSGNVYLYNILLSNYTMAHPVSLSYCLFLLKTLRFLMIKNMFKFFEYIHAIFFLFPLHFHFCHRCLDSVSTSNVYINV